MHKDSSYYNLENIRSDVIGIDAKVPLLDGSERTYVYLDNAASTPALGSVHRKVDEFLYWYSSIHRGAGFKSLIATNAYDQAREIVRDFVGGDPDEDVVIFGKNTTEAINTLANAFDWHPGDVVITSVMEHHSDDLPWRQAASHVIHIGLTADGLLDMDELEQQLKIHKGKVRLVAITGASNVTGAIPPIHEIAELAHQNGALILVDCAQLAPHRKVTKGKSGEPDSFDFVTISAHKMYAPYGTGALIGPKAFFEKLPPAQRGGGTIEVVTLDEVHWADAPERLEAGSPNVVGAIALAASIKTLNEIGMDALAEHERVLTRHALAGLQRIPGVRVYGENDPSLPNDRVGVISMDMDGIHHGKLAAILAFEGGIGVRNGCFCAHPYILSLLGITKEAFEVHKQEVLNHNRSNIPGMIRASFGCYTTQDEVDYFLEWIERVANGQFQGDYWVDKPSGFFYPKDFNQKNIENVFRF